VKRSKKYDVPGLPENQFEPGSKNQVLKNLSGIIKKRDMDQREAIEQLRTLEVIATLFTSGHTLTADDVCRIHRIWLGGIYSWAGEYRNVNIGKAGFQFAAAMHISQLMNEFEKNVLARCTPCQSTSHEEIAHALAVVHVELVLIHPFRDGNGRVARLVSIVMGWQAGLPTLDFGGITGEKKNEYFAAVRAGLARNYAPMTDVFMAIIKRTVQNAK